MSRSTAENSSASEDRSACLRLLIADDQPRVRQSLEALLTALGWSPASFTEIPICIVGAAESGQRAVEQVRILHPDVVVMDLRTHDPADGLQPAPPALDRLATIRSIKSQWPAVRVVVLTMYATGRSDVLRAGADAFLLKGCPMSEFLAAVLPAAR
jgi:DNA-binding NarL/FixJ family response regulator